MGERLVSSQARRNVLYTGIFAVVSAGVSFVSYSVGLRYLGLASYGLWFALSAVISLAQLGNLGLAPAVTKFVAEHFQQGRVDLVRATVASGVLLSALAMGSMALLLLLFRDLALGLLDLEPIYFGEARSLLPWVALLSAYTVVAQIGPAVLTGLGRSDQTALVLIGNRLVSLATAWLLLASGWGIWSLLIGNLVGTCFLQLVTYLLARRICPIPLLGFRDIHRPGLPALLRFGSGVAGSNAAQMAFMPLNRILLTRFVGVEAVPIFEIAWTGAIQVRHLLNTPLQALMPDFSASVAVLDQARVRHLMRQAYRVLFLLSSPLYLGLFTFAPWGLTIWLGQDFSRQATDPFRLMLVGSFINLLTTPIQLQLLGRGMTRDLFVGTLLQTAINALVALLLAFAGVLSPFSLSFSSTLGFAGMTAWLLFRGRSARLVPAP